MGGFKRFCLFVYSVMGILCLTALALPWFGLFGPETGALLETGWYVTAVEACLAVTALGLVVTLVRSIALRRPRAITVMDIDGGEVSVTVDAVASQAAHIAEEGGLVSAEDVSVRPRRHGPVDVTVKVTPFESVDVTAEAPALHSALTHGLAVMCGERLGTVSVEFLEPRRTSALGDERGAAAEAPVDGQALSQPDPPEPIAASRPEGQGITVAMRPERGE